MITQKQTIRAAVKIFDGLRDETPQPIATDAMESEYESLLRHCRNHRLAIERGWYAASENVRRKIEHCARYLEQSVFRLCRSADIEPTKRVVSLRDIYLDLLHLADEFDDVQIDRYSVSVVTEPIEFEGIDLGRFRISICIDGLDYSIEALEPNPSHNGYHHPHLTSESGQLCEGEGRRTIDSATASGRILDLFVVLRSILETYNSESPYCSIEEWSGNSCESCGGHYDSENSGGYCCRCDTEHCDDCVTYCVGCEDTICHSCVQNTCENCGCSLCSADCGQSCTECARLICGHCSESFYDGLCGDCETNRIENEEIEESETITTI